MNKTVHLTFFVVVLINVEKKQQLVEHGISHDNKTMERKSQKLSLKVEKKKLHVGFKWPCA